MKKKYGYEIREKGTEFVVGDDGGVYFDSEEDAIESAERYTTNCLIPNEDEYEGMTLGDFDIIIQERSK